MMFLSHCCFFGCVGNLDGSTSLNLCLKIFVFNLLKIDVRYLNVNKNASNAISSEIKRSFPRSRTATARREFELTQNPKLYFAYFHSHFFI